MNTLMKLIQQQQIEYSNNQNKKYLKDNSQFFTPTDIALKMIKTISMDNYVNKERITILEPSAGFGILIISLIQYILNFKKDTLFKKIIIDAYEIDNQISEALTKNLNLLKHILNKDYNISLEYNIINDNFILYNKNKWQINNNNHIYDIIISNPPFDKINQSSEESMIMPDIIHGQPNIYSLFIAMSLKLLKKDGTYVVLSPRNYLNGSYTTKLRNFIFNNFTLTHLHSFERRTIFNFVSQEVIIATYIGSKLQNSDVKISYNATSGFHTKFNDLISNAETKSLILPKSYQSLLVFKFFSQLQYSLKDLELKISVGPVVQFREKKIYKRSYIPGEDYPLLVSVDILENNTIDYHKRKNTKKTHNKSVSKKSERLIKNSNYVVIRKITAKNCSNILISAVLHEDFFETDKIGLDNNLVYFHRIDGNILNIEEAYGIYCFISSSYFKEMYSLINGTHTINVSDFDNIKFPSRNILISMGKSIIESNNFVEKKCDEIFEKYLVDNK